MPKLACSCGNWIQYGEIPSPHEWLFISDIDYDRHTGMIEIEELYRDSKSALRCPTCGTLFVFWEGFDHVPAEYSPKCSGKEEAT